MEVRCVNCGNVDDLTDYGDTVYCRHCSAHTYVGEGSVYELLKQAGSGSIRSPGNPILERRTVNMEETLRRLEITVSELSTKVADLEARARRSRTGPRPPII